jgi:cytochrome o ubiquinol oxidase subunit 3
VLRPNLYGKPDILKFTDLSYIFIETLALLASSFTFGMSMIAMYQGKLKKVIAWLVVTAALGAIFIGMEIGEFIRLVHDGFGWQENAAMSAFFTLVGTHGLHVAVGLLWITATIFQFSKFGLHAALKRRMAYLGLFWGFLDIIWIFLFTIVYLMGSL